jgi:hypothetical protein
MVLRSLPRLQAWRSVLMVVVVCLSLWADLLRFRVPVGERFARWLGTGAADFSAAYSGARALVNGLDPYAADLPEKFRDPWQRETVVGEIRSSHIYLPTYYLFHAPLVLAYKGRIERAARAWFVLNLCALAALVWLASRVQSLIARAHDVGTAAALLFLALGLSLHFGTQLGLERGQSDLMTSLLCWSAVLLAWQRRAGPALALAVLAALLKGYGLLFAVGLGFAFRGRSRRHAAVGAAGALVAFLLPVARYLPEGVALARAHSDDFSATWINHGFRNLAFHVSPALAVPGRLLLTVAALAATAVCWLLLRRTLGDDRRESSAVPLVLFAVTSLGTMIGYSSLSNAYDMILIMPGALILGVTQTDWIEGLGLGPAAEHLLAGALVLALTCLYLPRSVGASFSPASLGLVVLLLSAAASALIAWRRGVVKPPVRL